MKKEKSKVLIIACILVLLLFIILPPVFRRLFPDPPKEQTPVTNQNKISILQCNRIFATELYQVSVRVKYLNHNIHSNTMIYHKLETLPEGYQEVEASTPTAVLEEYNYLSKIEGIEMQREDPNLTLVLTQEAIIMNPEDPTLPTYFQEDMLNQKGFYEQRGYSCIINET